MDRITCISVMFFCTLKLSTAQEGLFGSLGQSGEMGLFEGFGQSGENGPLGGFLPFIGFGPFGAFGGYGMSGRNAAGGQGGSEAAAESGAEAAAEPTETSGQRQPSLMDINMMLIWNQLLGNQGYMTGNDGSGSSAQVSGTSGQQVTPQPDAPAPSKSSGQNTYSADMSWIPYFMLQH